MHSEKRRPARVLDFSALIPKFGILFCVLVPVLFWNSCLSAPQLPATVRRSAAVPCVSSQISMPSP